MAIARNDSVLRQIRTLFDAGSVASLSDGQLLDRFATRGGDSAEAAFAALVDRHGPRILRACRASLGDSHDAMDAFQATFLVLARRARTIRDRESVGGWLMGVAARVSAHSRRESARRRRVERLSADHRGDRGPVGNPDRDEVGALIREEVGLLPDRFREVVVLCDFEGRSCEEAAERLRCPVGTVKSRRATARAKLRDRLVRRGVVAPSAASIASALAAEAKAASPVPSILSKSTIEAALSFAANTASTASGEVPKAVVALAEGVIKTMIWTKSKYAVVAAGMLAVSGVGALGQQPKEAPNSIPSEPAAEARLKQVEEKLDRVLKTLEGPKAVAAPGSDRPFSHSYTPTATSPAARVVSVDQNGWTEMVPVYHRGKPPQEPGDPVASAAVEPKYSTVMIPRVVTTADGSQQTVSDTYRQAAGQSDAPLSLVRYADPAPTTPPVPPLPPVTTANWAAGSFQPTPQPAIAARPERIARVQTSPDFINRTYAAGTPRVEINYPPATDPISALDRRVSELEKRLDRLEKRLDGADRPSSTTIERTAPVLVPPPPALPAPPARPAPAPIPPTPPAPAPQPE